MLVLSTELQTQRVPLAKLNFRLLLSAERLQCNGKHQEGMILCFTKLRYDVIYISQLAHWGSLRSWWTVLLTNSSLFRNVHKRGFVKDFLFVFLFIFLQWVILSGQHVLFTGWKKLLVRRTELATDVLLFPAVTDCICTPLWNNESNSIKLSSLRTINTPRKYKGMFTALQFSRPYNCNSMLYWPRLDSLLLVTPG